MLEIKYLTKTYKKIDAVKDLNLTIGDGEIGILVGPNGAGKSTTIKCISGLLKYVGNITIDGHPNKSIEGKKIFSYVPELSKGMQQKLSICCALITKPKLLIFTSPMKPQNVLLYGFL